MCTGRQGAASATCTFVADLTMVGGGVGWDGIKQRGTDLTVKTREQILQALQSYCLCCNSSILLLQRKHAQTICKCWIWPWTLVCLLPG